MDNRRILLLAIILVFAGVSVSAAPIRFYWETDFNWNRYSTLPTPPVVEGIAHLGGNVTITDDNHLIGEFELKRCSGDPDAFNSFNGKNMFLTVPVPKCNFSLGDNTDPVAVSACFGMMDSDVPTFYLNGAIISIQRQTPDSWSATTETGQTWLLKLSGDSVNIYNGTEEGGNLRLTVDAKPDVRYPELTRVFYKLGYKDTYISSTPYVTGDIMKLTFDKIVPSSFSKMIPEYPDRWNVMFYFLFLNPPAQSPCTKCSAFNIATPADYSNPVCTLMGPEVEDLAISPGQELRCDDITDVNVTCYVWDHTEDYPYGHPGILSVENELTLPNNVKIVHPMFQRAGTAISDNYWYTYNRTVIDDWVNTQGMSGLYWVRILATDADLNKNNYVYTWFNFTGPTCASTTTTTSTTTSTTLGPSLPTTGLNVTFEFFFFDSNPLQYCNLWSNITGSWGAERLPSASLYVNRYTKFVPDGTYRWNVDCKTDTNDTTLSENDWTFTVCSTCKTCSNSCADMGFQYGTCRPACDPTETQSDGLCDNPALPTCCCGNVFPTTSTTIPPTSPTTTLHLAVCGDGHTEIPEMCDPPRLNANETIITASGTIPAQCDNDLNNCNDICLCSTEEPSTTSTTSTTSTSTTSTTIPAPTTSTTSTTSTTTTTTTSTTTTTLPPLVTTFSGGFDWTSNYNVWGAAQPLAGKGKIQSGTATYSGGSWVGDFTIHRCSGTQDWSAFQPINIFFEFNTVNGWRSFYVHSTEMTISPDSIIVHFDQVYTSPQPISSATYIAFDNLVMNGVQAPGSPHRIWLSSGTSNPVDSSCP